MDLEKGWRFHQLDDEPFCCEPNYDDDEILCAGSDDEYYEDSTQRSRRYEDAARRYLSGRPAVLLTSILRGPFEGPEANGWVNPWRSQRNKLSHPGSTTTPKIPISGGTVPTEVADADSTTSCHLPSPRSLDQPDATPHPFMEEEEVVRVHEWRQAAVSVSEEEEPTWSFSSDMSTSQSRSQRKRRTDGSDWLKRRDSKRQKPDYSDVEEFSMIAQPYTQAPSKGPFHSQTSQLAQPGAMEHDDTRRFSGSQNVSGSSQRTPRKDSRLLPQAIEEGAHVGQEPEPAPLSTPIQTPKSSQKSRGTPRASAIEEIMPRSNAMTTAQLGSESEAFETQQDRSFLFRARPRSRGIEVEGNQGESNEAQGHEAQGNEAQGNEVQGNEIQGNEVQGNELEGGRKRVLSSSASTVTSESDSVTENEALDLEGDTCMADVTKATSPQSSAEDKAKTFDEDVLTGIQAQVKPGNESDIEPAATPLDKLDLDANAKKGAEMEMPQTDAKYATIIQTIEAAPSTDCESSDEDKSKDEETEGSDDEGRSDEANKKSGEDNEFIHAPEDESDTETESTTSSREGSVYSPEPRKAPTKPALPANQDESQRRSSQRLSLLQSPWSKTEAFSASSPLRSSQSRQSSQQRDATRTPNRSRRSKNALSGAGNSAQGAATRPSKMPDTEHRADKNAEAHHPPSQPITCLSPKRFEPKYDSPIVRPSQQSPWKADTVVGSPPRALKAVDESTQTSNVNPGCQSPWASSPELLRQAAQEALVADVFGAPAARSPSPMDSLPPPKPPTSTVNSPTPISAAATPGKPSSPEPVFEIKRFANFMSPSPERPRRKRNPALLNGEHLPSTQNLLAATIDNPWENAPKSAKRVKWAPLPHELDGAEGTEADEPRTPVARAASPPPAAVPTDDDERCQKFQKHFEAVSRRTKLRHRLLPSASQQVFESPAAMAMAEAFVAADSFAVSTPSAPKALMVPINTPTAPERAPEALMLPIDTPMAPGEPSREPPVDDVDDVLQNLNDFISMMDVEAELAQVKKDEEKRGENQKSKAATSMPLSFLDGITDAGVWD
ncbi:hypothetical protein C8034_v005112 [Colletotrichum sidae]|uniref:Protamine P1 n=1 Tax=Colletotrichum sidae TaxID=1347389 RepID=A0A4V3I229_9PEZI|nr:hypothetical protein C8034_v005112 [Colletotrichum sidae]